MKPSNKNYTQANLFESDLTTDLHDKIMLWVNDNYPDVINSIDSNILKCHLETGGGELIRELSFDEIKEQIHHQNNGILFSTKWENPVRKIYDYKGRQVSIMGFIDFCIYIDLKKIFPNEDLIINQNYFQVININIEVKSRIKNVGELIRQINYYKEFQNGIYIVVSPDDKFKNILKQERIHHFKYNLNS